HTIFSRDWSSDVCSSDLLEYEHENSDSTHEAGQKVFHRNATPDVAQPHVTERADDHNADPRPEVSSIERHDEHRCHGQGPRPWRSEERRVGKEWPMQRAR